jgi:hypothetical protein
VTPFGEWLQRHGISYADAARVLHGPKGLELSRAHIHLLATGKASPRLKTLGLEIEAWTRQLDPEDYVPVASWLPYCAQFDGVKLA